MAPQPSVKTKHQACATATTLALLEAGLLVTEELALTVGRMVIGELGERAPDSLFRLAWALRHNPELQVMPGDDGEPGLVYVTAACNRAAARSNPAFARAASLCQWLPLANPDRLQLYAAAHARHWNNPGKPEPAPSTGQPGAIAAIIRLHADR